ncbi:diguanylate cyclase [Altererythrobacter sp. B11]|uniref:GGDEF domain-containing phosphodiesterase n=1 Tax=Altererythrobacter sp. B11 TaxID=2060312 RepID=UPI000DC742F2|nr:GGDEF domain-containing phosphodiesterase [Altererythrobacter sp. B11]BBC72944.1 diguanylate cyclase [Altererythrobacter sp. B11]
MAGGRDRLTGLIGADAACTVIAQWQQAARAEGTVPSIHAVLLGLRRFEAVNLAYGEAAGDLALAGIADRLQHFAQGEMEGEWLISRISGGTFLLAAKGQCARERWQWLAEEMARTVSAPIAGLDGGATVRLWPRMALLRAAAAETPVRMIQRLAETLERAQGEPGRQLLWVDGTVTPPERAGQQLEADLLAALDREEIEILFQPQFRCGDGRVLGAEALARWQHPQLGRIGAGALFAIAERADYVSQLSRHIARAALGAAAAWPARFSLSLNVTAADLGSGSFADVIEGKLRDTGFAPERLTLEITEQALVTEIDGSARRLRRLADLGIRIALDDFGAGFCNFGYLKALPLDYLKLDRSMLEGVAEDARDLAILRGILAMARALELDVIAEGVESEAQRGIVEREGCAAWQGFLGAPPLPASELATFLR